MDEVLAHYRMEAISHSKNYETAQTQSLDLDRHTAASLMQKSIRRSERRLALGSAKLLYEIEPRRLWRRLITTVFEDVGIADQDLALTALSLAPTRTHKPVEWAVVSMLVENLCSAKKTQRANHLVQLAHFDSHEILSMCGFDGLSFERAVEWIEKETTTLVQKVRAAWLLSALETGRKSEPVAHPQADLIKLREYFHQFLNSTELSTILDIGIKLTKSSLPFAAVLASHLGSSARPTHKLSFGSDLVPPARSTWKIPNWAFDQYTRTGKRSLARAARECADVSASLTGLKEHSSKVQALQWVHFEIESGCLKKRIECPSDRNLLKRVRSNGPGLTPANAQSIYQAFYSDWEQFEEIRCSEIASVFVD